VESGTSTAGHGTAGGAPDGHCAPGPGLDAEDAQRWIASYPRLAVFFREVQRQTSCSATELAVLFALGTSGGTAVGALRERLTADAGHLSRVLARFEREGMVTRSVSGRDHRRQQVTLTALGMQRRAGLGTIVAAAARTHPPLGRIAQ
jgi:DNA-binding MarR family transcriptional regulator